MTLIERLDRFQRSHKRAGRPIAVIYKFADDQGNYLAALIAFYGFLSLFPLLLLASTILNFVLHGHPKLQQELFDSALGQLPIVGRQLADPNGVSGNGVVLVFGILGTLYGGLGVAQAIQNAMNTIWRVPRNQRPNPFASRLRSLLVLGVLALSVIGTTILATLGSIFDGFGVWTKIGLGIGTFVVNAVVFTAVFTLCTARPLTWRQTVPGAAGAGLVWQLLQYVGALYVGHVVKGADEINGVFALVLGLITWIYLEALVVVLAVEYNTVASLKLYPRALLTPFTDEVELTSADQRAYTEQAQAQRFKGFQKIRVEFDPPEE